MTQLPDHVYMITVDGEWPVTAIVDDHVTTAARVERAVNERAASLNVYRPDQVRVWKARLADVREVDLVPPVTVPATLRERPGKVTSELIEPVTALRSRSCPTCRSTGGRRVVGMADSDTPWFCGDRWHDEEETTDA